jgi:hypothetical protein
VVVDAREAGVQLALKRRVGHRGATQRQAARRNRPVPPALLRRDLAAAANTEVVAGVQPLPWRHGLRCGHQLRERGVVRWGAVSWEGVSIPWRRCRAAKPRRALPR